MLLKEYIEKNKQRIDFVYGKINNYEYLYLKNGIHTLIWQQEFLPKLQTDTLENISPGLIEKINKSSKENFDRLIGLGNILLLKNSEEFVIFLSFPPKRQPQDSINDPSNLIGSRDGFNEILADNRNLIKKRIKNTALKFDEFTLGIDTLTEINIMYLENKISEDILNQIKMIVQNNINQNITSILDINKLLSSNYLVPLFESTGSPETCVNALLNNRIVILIDNCPNALIIPSSLFEFTENVNEVNSYSYSTIFNRIFILIFLFISLFSLGLFIVLTSHHPEALSTIFIANFQLTERGTTFPLIIEIIIVLTLFEFYRLMTSRSPLSFVQNIIIIFGGLFIGQNAIEASLIGSISIIVASLSFVSSFAVTNNQYLITSFSIFRLFILIMSFVLGIIGFIISSILIINYLANIKVFQSAYLTPFIPWDKEKIKAWFKPTKE